MLRLTDIHQKSSIGLFYFMKVQVVMSWFRRKTTMEPALTPEQLVVRETKKVEELELDLKKIFWLKTVSNSELLDAFSNFESTVRNVTQDPEYLHFEERVVWRRALDAFSQIHRFWFDIDRNLVDDQQALLMFDMVNELIPQSVSSYASSSVTSGLERAWDYHGGHSKAGMAYNFEQIFIWISQIRNSQMTSFAFQNIPPAMSNEITFPSPSSDNKQVTATLFRISELWKQASSRKNSIEDEYFLEQVATSYIPEAWKLFDTFRFAPDESKTIAAEILMEQLALIEHHIVHILKQSLEQSLVAMRSQVGFLKVKTATPEISSLRLNMIEAG